MESAFWHSCWENNTIGFHQQQVNSLLRQYMPSLVKPSDRHVFVPLCGKSLDMYWLAEQLTVTGAELSAIACRDFFADSDVNFKQQTQGDFVCYNGLNISLWQGDFFKLTAKQLKPVDWIYDRAALIALPKAMQQQYVAHLLSFFQDKTRLLLLTLEFPENEMSGPPFPVFEADLPQLFPGFVVDCLASQAIENKQFAQRIFPVSHLVEKLYLITKA